MSGFEVVGVVLGALPLIISAFEHGQSVAKKWNLLANFNSENLKVWNDVKDEELMFRLQLQTLLAPLVRDGDLAKDRLEILLLSPKSDAWKDADFDTALKRRLGESHDRYLGNVEEIQILTWQLLQPLARASAFKDKINARKSTPKDQIMLKAYKRLTDRYKHEDNRLRFAISKDQRDETLSEIHAKIKKLERILAASDQVAAFEEPSKLVVSRQSVNNLMGYWRHADRIFALLLSSWVCPCRQTHCAHLWLQHRTSAHFEFRMLVMFAPANSNSSQVAPWRQHGLKIEWASLCDPVASKIVATALIPSPQKVVLPSAIAGQQVKSGILSRFNKGNRPAKASIRFEDSLNFPKIIPSGNQVTSGSASVLSEPSSKRSKLSAVDATTLPQAATAVSRDVIKNLCHTMESCGMQSQCLGMLVGLDQGDRYQVSSQPEQKVVAGEITLWEILSRGHKPRVSRAQRFQIALKIASSHLQLHSTSWARRHWESGDVRFPQAGTTTADILLDRPFVSATFEPDLPSAMRVPKVTDRSFACLGIMMLELLFGAQLEEHELWQQFGANSSDNPLIRLMVAKQWADDVKDEAGPEFSSAVKWCLDESPATLHGDQWRKDLACEVVLPLQNCCGWIDAGNVVDD